MARLSVAEQAYPMLFQGNNTKKNAREETGTHVARQEHGGGTYAVINIAEAICPSASGGRPPALDTSFTVVASTIATAVAEVVGQCAGDGNARLTIQTRARADISTRAAAVGRASKDIVAASGVCPQCEEVLLAFADAIEAMPVTAVAEVTINVRRPFLRHGLEEFPLKDEMIHGISTCDQCTSDNLFCEKVEFIHSDIYLIIVKPSPACFGKA